MIICGPNCWTPVWCRVCGREFPPVGRSVAIEAASCYCDLDSPCYQGDLLEACHRHLWDEHDSNRQIADPQGWAEHVRGCQLCEAES